MATDINLLKRYLPMGDYGEGEAKSFDQLLAEIESEESQIIWLENRPIRLLRIVFLIVYCQNQMLYEERQEFPDGRIRYRGIVGISEKLRPNECHDQAVSRALLEEMGLSISEIPLLEIRFIGQEIEIKTSPSYPGLESHYEKYTYKIHLPDSLYKAEYIEFCEDGMRTFFRWKELD